MPGCIVCNLPLSTAAWAFGTAEAGWFRRRCGLWPPVPRQEFGQSRHRQGRDAVKDVGQPSLGVDVVEFRGADQGVHDRGAHAAAIGAAEQPCFTAEGHAAQRSFGRVVAQADAAILEEAGEGGPALEHVVDRLGDLGVARQPGTLGAHPGFERCDHRGDMRLAISQPLRCRVPVDLALPGEDGVDLADCFQRQWRWWSFPGAGQIRELEEATPGMGPAQRFGDGPAGPCRRVEPTEAGIGVRLKNPRIAGKVLLGVLAPLVGRVVEEAGGPSQTKGAIVADIDPSTAEPSIRQRSCARQETREGRPVVVLPLASTGVSSPCSRSAASTCRRISSCSGAKTAAAVPTRSARVERSRSTPSRR